MADKISQRKLLRILEKSNGKCWYCGIELLIQEFNDRNIPSNLLCIEHQVPKIKGGTNEEENLVASCWQCNSQKRGRNVEEWKIRLKYEAESIEPFTSTQLAWLSKHGIEVYTILNDKWQINFYGENIELVD